MFSGMSIELGKTNRLTVVKEVDFGMYLDGGDDGEILLPRRYVPSGCKPGDELDVFIYLDNEERLVATTLRPAAEVGGMAGMRVAWTNRYGAFMDWGLMKDLFVPFREQEVRMQVGEVYVVHVHLDPDSFRIVGSSRLERWLSPARPDLRPGEEVEALVWRRTPLGWLCVVDGAHQGMVYANESFGHEMRPGLSLRTYVKQVRNDGKVDLSLHRSGRDGVDDVARLLMDYLHEHGGRTRLCDHSPAEEIYRELGVSKKQFKKAVGELYSRRMIVVEEGGIFLNGQ